jgi:hypothetical protein
MLVSASAHAANYCAHTGTDLVTYLAEVSTDGTANNHDNTIRLSGGTFTTSGDPFTFKSASGFALTIEGGYDTNA